VADAATLAMPRSGSRLALWIPIAVVAVDQATKLMVRRAIPLYESVTVVPNLVDFTHVRNTGTAFGFMNAMDFPFKTVVIALVAIVALFAMAAYSRTLGGGQWLARIGLALIIGGAAGNLIDRFFVGSVVDFVDVYWRDWHFWAFNVADSAITFGVIAMILDMLGVGTHVSKTV
jgi:signal peptidase II